MLKRFREGFSKRFWQVTSASLKMADITEAKQLLDRRRLVVKNIPPNVSADHLRNFLEVLAQIEIIELKFEPDVEGNLCLVKFSVEVTDENMKDFTERALRKVLSGQEIVSEPVFVCSKILVHNTSHSKEILTLYFENGEKSGGGHIKDVAVYPTIQKAVLKFENDKVVDRVLERKHSIQNTWVTVEIYVSNYHQIILEKLLTLKSSNEQGSLEKSESREENGKTVIGSADFTDEIDIPNSEEGEEQEQEEDGSDLQTEADTTTTNVSRKEDFMDEIGFPSMEETEKTDEAGVHPQTELDRTTSVSRKDDPQLPEAEEEEKEEYDETTDSVNGKSKSDSCQQDVYLVNEKKKISRPKLLLLEKIGLTKIDVCNKCSIKVDIDNSCINFHGNKKDVDTSILCMFEITQKMILKPILAGQTAVKALLASEICVNVIELIIDNMEVIIYHDQDTDCLSAVGVGEEQVNKTIDLVQQRLCLLSIPFLPNNVTFLSSNDWMKFVDGKNRTGTIRITTEIEQKVISVLGLKSDVLETKSLIEKALEDSLIVEMAMPMDNLKARFMRTHCQSEMATIKEQLRDKGIKIEITEDSISGDVKIKVISSQVVIHLGETKLRELEAKLCKFEVKIPDHVSKTSYWRKFVGSLSLKNWLEEQQNYFQCCLEMKSVDRRVQKLLEAQQIENTTKKSPAVKYGGKKVSIKSRSSELKQPAPQQGKTEKQREKKTICFKHNATQIILTMGDITKEKADVLVNVVHPSLHLEKGEISKHFLAAGGKELQEELHRTRKEPEISQRVRVFETPGCGNLTCSSVLHVTPNFGPQDPKGHLKEIVRLCLAKSKNCSTIAFPAIGCGKLGYSPEKAAREMISEVRDFLTNFVSRIQTVKFVMIDAQIFNIFHGVFRYEFRSTSTQPGLTSEEVFNFQEITKARSTPNLKMGLPAGPAKPQTIKKAPTERITIGDITIMLKHGDIISEKVDVMVNVTNTSLNLSKGKISQIFLKAGGPDLQTSLSNYGEAQDGDVMVIPACGNLICDYVANVVLPKWKGQESLKILNDAVTECLTEAAKTSESIAFPSLGCGALRYPPDLAAATIIQAIYNFVAKSKKLKLIALVVFELSLFENFSSNLLNCSSSNTPGASGTTDASETASSYDNSVSMRTSAAPPDARETASSDDNSVSVSTSAASTEQSVEGQEEVLSGVTFKGKVKKTKEDILSSIGDQFHSETIHVKKIFPKTERAVKVLTTERVSLEAESDKHEVGIDIDLKKCEVVIHGPYKNVIQARKLLKDLLKQCRSPITFEDICDTEVERPTEYPEYWKVMRDTKSDNKVIFDLQSPAILDAVTKIAESTWMPQFVSYGRDAAGIDSNSSMTVKKIEMVKNKELFQKYFKARQHLFNKVKKREITILGSNTEPTALTKAHVTTEMTHTMKNEVNEFFLFHGTKTETAQAICSTGFDFRLARLEGMLGKGVYFTESTTKADQYTDSKSQRSDGKNLKMILARVCMGDVFVCSDNNPQKYRRPPCKTCNVEECTLHTNFYDSILFNNPKKNFREFLIYTMDQCYPEFVITYDRV